MTSILELSGLAHDQQCPVRHEHKPVVSQQNI